jgi:endonuclease YncB( thermonuclease family)
MMNVLVPVALAGAAYLLFRNDPKPAKVRTSPRSKGAKASPKLEKVVRVVDGDTFSTDARPERVRLRSLNAPELNEPGGRKAKKALENAILGKKVRLEIVSHDRFGRAVAQVYLGNRSVARMLTPAKTSETRKGGRR